MLQGIDDADRQGHLPVVDMERHPTRYNEDGDELGTKNAWEYYFEQPAGQSLAEALTLDPLDNQGSEEGGLVVFKSAVYPQEMIDRGRELVRKYIRVKPHILAEADALIPSGVHSHVLGIHVRGTDQRAGSSPDHPVGQAAAVYLEQAVALDRDHGFHQVFLACDETETLDLFRDHFGPRLVTTLAHRTSGSAAADGTYPDNYEWLFAPRRNHHCYLLGLEVLLDVLLLARCGHLLCGRSNVGKAARWFSDERQVVHMVPPLWCAPPHRGQSVGRSTLEASPPFPRPISATALEIQVKELQRLLEMTENSRAATYAEMDVLNERLVVALTDLKTTHDKWVDARQEAKAAKKAAAALAKEAKQAASAVKQLQERILQLINGWTRLGWRLMPWTKPSWRHKPTTPSIKDPSEV